MGHVKQRQTTHLSNIPVRANFQLYIRAAVLNLPPARVDCNFQAVVPLYVAGRNKYSMKNTFRAFVAHFDALSRVRNFVCARDCILHSANIRR